MDYKELVGRLNTLGDFWKAWQGKESCFYDAATAIKELLVRAEAAEARVRELEISFRAKRCENGPECVKLGKMRKALSEAEAQLARTHEELDKMEALHEAARRELGEVRARVKKAERVTDLAPFQEEGAVC